MTVLRFSVNLLEFLTFDCIEPSLGGTCTVPQTLHATYTCLFPYPMVY